MGTHALVLAAIASVVPPVTADFSAAVRPSSIDRAPRRRGRSISPRHLPLSATYVAWQRPALASRVSLSRKRAHACHECGAWCVRPILERPRSRRFFERIVYTTNYYRHKKAHACILVSVAFAQPQQLMLFYSPRPCVVFSFLPLIRLKKKHVHAYAYTTTATRFRWLAALCAGACRGAMHASFF